MIVPRIAFLAILFAAFAAPVLAFPPAPGFTVFGIVRDEFGWAIDQADAELLCRTADGTIIARTAIRSAGVNENYRVVIPLDHARTGPAYKPTATTAGVPFSVEVVLSGLTFYPIETAVHPLNGSRAAGFLHLDLTLGSDSDLDHLPDEWEMWQLEAKGLDFWRIDLMDADGDLDGDGLSNGDEHIAGTFAFLLGDTLYLEVVKRGADNWATLEFPAVIDKTYTLERSTDLETWVPVDFTITADRGRLVNSWKAPDTTLKIVEAEAPESRSFFRLRVR